MGIKCSFSREFSCEEMEYAKKWDRRRQLLDELCSTEETYLDGLNQLNSEWVEPLGDMPFIQKNCHNLWFHIKAIRELHSKMLPLLQKNESLGKVILEHAGWFKAYGEFISQYPSMLQTLDEAQKRSKDVRKFFEQNKQRGVTVSTLLITPIQRIPLYSSLLKELVELGNQLGRFMKENEHADEIQAQQKIDEITQHLNERKRAIDESTSFFEVSCRIRGRETSLWSPSRIYLDEVEVQSVTRFGRNKVNTLFLFSDIAVLVDEGSKFKKEYPLVRVEFLLSPKDGRGISIRKLTDSGEPGSTITFLTKDEITASKWMEKFSAAREKQIAKQACQLSTVNYNETAAKKADMERQKQNRGSKKKRRSKKKKAADEKIDDGKNEVEDTASCVQKNPRTYFISYKQAESKDLALDLWHGLGGNNKSPGAWLDVKNDAGQTKDDMIAGVRECKYFLLILTQGYFDSQYCRLEFNHAIDAGKEAIMVYNTDQIAKGSIHKELTKAKNNGVNLRDWPSALPISTEKSVFEAQLKKILRMKPMKLVRVSVVD